MFLIMFPGVASHLLVGEVCSTCNRCDNCCMGSPRVFPDSFERPARARFLLALIDHLEVAASFGMWLSVFTPDDPRCERVFPEGDVSQHILDRPLPSCPRC